MKKWISFMTIIVLLSSISQSVSYAATEPPAVVTNAGIEVDEGGTAQIDVVNLASNDSDTDSTILNYIITTAPRFGRIENTNNPGVVITSFKQQDIIYGRIVYIHNGSNTTSDSFVFKVVDDTGNEDANNTFQITINPKDFDPPTIISTSLAVGNDYMDIVFSEGVYGSPDGSTPITINDLEMFFYRKMGKAGAVIINAISQNNHIDDGMASGLIGGETVIRVFLNMTGFSDGQETIEVKPSVDALIYDKAGNVMELSETTGVIYLLPSNEQRVMADVVWLDITRLLGDNLIPGEIASDLTLPMVGAYGTTISWESSDEMIIDMNGHVVLPTYDEGSQDITLTATIATSGISETKEFMVTVLTENAPIPGENINEGTRIYSNPASGKDTLRVEKIVEVLGADLISGVVDTLILVDNVEVTDLDRYVDVLIPVLEDVDISKDITGVILEEDGSLVPVITDIVLLEGKYYGQIKARTTGVYGLISYKIMNTDLEGHWVEEDGTDLANRLIVSANQEGLYLPDESITRGEFVDIIVKALGIYRSYEGENSFKDVDKGHQYYHGIESSYKYGLIEGVGNGRFLPDNYITREAALTIVARAMEFVELDVELSADEIALAIERFEDKGDISEWALDAVSVCVDGQIVIGDKNKLMPKKEITRAETITIAVRLMNKLEE